MLDPETLRYHAAMAWMRRPRRWLRLKGEIFCETHSRWLTLAVTRPRKYPRIPVMPEEEGGFRDLRKRPGGDVLMDWWWVNTLDGVDSPRRTRR